jgi:hypothetical protein
MRERNANERESRCDGQSGREPEDSRAAARKGAPGQEAPEETTEDTGGFEWDVGQPDVAPDR